MKILIIHPFLASLHLAGTTIAGCLPEAAPLEKYSYHANKSMTPHFNITGLSSIHYPMVVLMRSKDEAISAPDPKKAILKNKKGEIQIIGEASPNGVRHNIQSFIFVKDGFSTL